MRKIIKKPTHQLAAPLVMFLLITGVSLGIISGWVNALLPTIHTVDPASGPDSGGQTVTVTGEGFMKRADFQPGSISASGGHACATTLETEQLYCWGANWDGQLGINNNNNSLITVAVDTSGVLAGKVVKQISTTSRHTCVVTTDDQAYCWGYNSVGQLGNNSTNNSLTPTTFETGGVLTGKTFKQISTNILNTCIVTTDGLVYCWGDNTSGRLGNGNTIGSLAPVAVDTSGVLNGKTIQQVSTGSGHVCAIDSDGQAYCWGGGGALGNGGTTDSSIPVSVDTSGVLNGKIIQQISAGRGHTCALTSDGQAYCWGRGNYGQLGNNNTANSTIPVAVDTSGVLDGKTIKQLSANSDHTCAVTTDGLVYCWGQNWNGQLGNGTNANSPIPVAVDTSGVLGGKIVQQVSSSDINYTCATTTDGQAYCWGNNWTGGLGSGNTTYSSVPVAVNMSNLPIVPNIQSILFGAVPATSFTVDSATQLTAITPAHPAGLVDVTLFNTKNQPVVLTGGYEFMAPLKPNIPQAPGTGVGGKDLLTMTGLTLIAIGLSLTVHYKASQPTKWF